MKRYELKIILIQPSSRAVLIHKSRYPFEWLAVVAAWWHGRHFGCLEEKQLFAMETIINKV